MLLQTWLATTLHILAIGSYLLLAHTTASYWLSAHLQEIVLRPTGTSIDLLLPAGTVQPSQEIEELRWVTSDCPHSDLSVTGVMILDDLKAKDLID